MNTQRKKPKESEAARKYGGWDFGRDFFSGVFGLLNSGRIFPAFGVLILALMGLVVWRLPESELASLAREFFGVLRSSFGLAMSLLVASNLMWAWLFKRQKRIYENEIDRLVEIRSELLHQGSNIIPIKNHRSSDGEQIEGYILPDVNGKESEEKNR